MDIDRLPLRPVRLTAHTVQHISLQENAIEAVMEDDVKARLVHGAPGAEFEVKLAVRPSRRLWEADISDGAVPLEQPAGGLAAEHVQDDRADGALTGAQSPASHAVRAGRRRHEEASSVGAGAGQSGQPDDAGPVLERL